METPSSTTTAPAPAPTKSKWWIPHLVGMLLSLLLSTIIMINGNTLFLREFIKASYTHQTLFQSALICIAIYGLGFSLAVAPGRSETAMKTTCIVSFIVATFFFVIYFSTYMFYLFYI